jgi:hypothetical protein
MVCIHIPIFEGEETGGIADSEERKVHALLAGIVRSEDMGEWSAIIDNVVTVGNGDHFGMY